MKAHSSLLRPHPNQEKKLEGFQWEKLKSGGSVPFKLFQIKKFAVPINSLPFLFFSLLLLRLLLFEDHVGHLLVPQ